MNPARKKSEQPRDDRHMSLLRAAAELGCSRQGILTLVAKGELQADTVAERVVVTRDSVAALKASREAAEQAASV